MSRFTRVGLLAAVLAVPGVAGCDSSSAPTDAVSEAKVGGDVTSKKGFKVMQPPTKGGTGKAGSKK